MSSSGVPASAVSLKDRIAALQQNKASGATTAGSSSAHSSRSNTPAPNGSPGSGNNLVGGSLRDRISKFESKGGTPVPRGSFGMGVAMPEDTGSNKRRGELYGNRVAGLSHTHYTPNTGRSVSSSGIPTQRGDNDHRRVFSSNGTYEDYDSNYDPSSRATSPAPLTPQMTGMSALSPQVTGNALLSPQLTGNTPLQPAPPVDSSLDTTVPPLSPIAASPTTPPAPPSPAEKALADVINTSLVNESNTSAGPDPIPQVVVSAKEDDLLAAAPIEHVSSENPDGSSPVSPTRSGEILTGISPNSGVDRPSQNTAPSTEPVSSTLDKLPNAPEQPTISVTTAEVEDVTVSTPQANAPLPSTVPPIVISEDTPVEASIVQFTSGSSAPSEPGTRADHLPKSPIRPEAPRSPLASPPASALTAASTATSSPASPLRSGEFTPSVDAQFDMSPPASSDSSTDPFAAATVLHQVNIPSAEPPHSAQSASSPDAITSPVVPTPPTPTFEPSSSQKSFHAVVGRRHTITKASARPATVYTDAPIPHVPKVPVHTVSDADISYTTEDLGALLANAAMLEERLAHGRTGTPRKEVFSVPAIPHTRGEVPSSWHPPTSNGVEKRNPSAHVKEPSHGRTDSDSTLKGVAVRPMSSKKSTDDMRRRPPALAELVPQHVPDVPTTPVPEFSDFQVQELTLPETQATRLSSDSSIPPTPPPKSPMPDGPLASLRTKSSSAFRRVSMMLHDDAANRLSVSSSDDSSMTMTNPPDVSPHVHVAPDHHSRNPSYLRDDAASFMSKESHASSGWGSLKGVSPRKSKSALGRAATMAEKIWPGSRRSRAASSSNHADNSMTDETHPRAPSPAPSLQPLAFDHNTDEFGSLSPSLSPTTLEAPPRSSRHDSWMSTGSSLSSPGIDKLVHQFPSVPQGPSQALQPISTSTLPAAKFGEDGMLLTPPDRSSSLGGLSRSTTSAASVRSKRKF